MIDGWWGGSIRVVVVRPCDMRDAPARCFLLRPAFMRAFAPCALTAPCLRLLTLPRFSIDPLPRVDVAFECGRCSCLAVMVGPGSFRVMPIFLPLQVASQVGGGIELLLCVVADTPGSARPWVLRDARGQSRPPSIALPASHLPTH